MSKVKDEWVNLSINGKAVSVPKGTTVFQAAEKAGFFIPHYCYHPDLPVAGVCRMCLVEVEKNPKLQISCNTPVAEGMVIKANSDRVKEAVKGVLELHLINHPLDCPICDKAGECKLQDFYVDYGLYPSRIPMSEKVHKPKVVDIGTIVLDSERCILCTRCVRFTADVTKTFELGIFNRGDRSVLKTYDDGPLQNNYTGNLADICPVGALTAKDFRFQCRVWFLEKTESVCTLCARGCNTEISVNPQNKKLHRVEPRRNPEVNSSWICDEGRWNYHYVTAENRVKAPLRLFEGAFQEQSWDHSLAQLHREIAEHPESVLVALSTAMTNEEIADSVLTFKELGVERFVRVVDDSAAGDETPYDGVLRHRDQTPNTAGFQRVMKFTKTKWSPLKKADELLKGVKRVIVLGLEGNDPPGLGALLEQLPKGAKLALHLTNHHAAGFERADLILPNVSAYEKSGTAVNVLGRLQRLQAALPWQYLGRDAHAVVFGMKAGNDRQGLPIGRPEQMYNGYLHEKWALEEEGATGFRSLPALGVAVATEAS